MKSVFFFALAAVTLTQSAFAAGEVEISGRTVVVHPPYIRATCPRAYDNGFRVSPRLSAVSATVNDVEFLMSYKTELSVCEFSDGKFAWKQVSNPYDYEVQYLSADLTWEKRREVIDQRINPMNRVEMVTGVSENFSTKVKTKLTKTRDNALAGTVKFELAKIFTNQQVAQLAVGKPVTVRFEASTLINATMLFNNRVTEGSQMGDIPYSGSTIDVTFSRNEANELSVNSVSVLR